MGGSSKKATVGYKYYLGVHFGLWKGPIDQITQISVDKRRAWPPEGEEPSLPITIDAPELFGGEAREGGVSGLVDIEFGESGQLQNDYLVEQLGSSVPAYRGITTAVLRQAYMGNNPYLKPWAFRGERIHTRQDGIEQWYDEKAEIPSLKAYWEGTEGQEIDYCIDLDYDLYETVSYPFNTEHYNPDGILGATYADPNGPVVATITGASVTDVFVVRKLPATGNARAYAFGWPQEDGVDIYTNRFFVTNAENESVLYWPSVFDNFAPAYAYVLSQPDVVITGSTAYKLWLWDDLIRGGQGLDPTGGGTFSVEILTPNVDGRSCFETYSCNDMNPAHIIRECLTDPDWGMGYAEADIDDDAFMSAADALHSEVFGLSISWTREGPLIDFVNEILRHIDAVLYVDRTTGKFVLNLIRDDYVIGDLLVLDESNVASVSDASRPAIADLVSSVTVNFYDRGTGEDGSITHHNQSLLQTQQGSSGATVAYPAVTSPVLADRLCQRDLTALSTPLLGCQIEVWRIAESLNIGDPFILTWPDLDIDAVVMRVQQMTLGDSEKQTIIIEALEDAFALPSLLDSTGNLQSSIWTDPLAATILPASPRIVTEAPYYEMVAEYGLGNVTDTLAADENAGYLLAAGGRQGTETNARLFVDAGAGYLETDPLDFCPVALTAAALTPAATSITLSGQVDIDLIEVGTLAQIDSELVRIDVIDTDSSGIVSLTVGRGCLDTVPAEHAIGAGVVVWGYDWTGDGVQYTASEELDVIMRPQLGANILATADAPVDTFTMASRAIRPYAPGNLKIDTVSYPPLISAGGVFYSADHTLTWAHRDRLQQTGAIIEDHTATDIGPEAGTTYRIDVYAVLDDDSEVALGSFAGITGTSYTMSPSAVDPVPDATASVNFKVTAVRDGYDSWQSAMCRTIAIFPGVARTLQDGTPRTLEDGTSRVTES